MARARKLVLRAGGITLASLLSGIGPGATTQASDLPEPAAWMPAEATIIGYLDVAGLIASPALGGLEDSLIRQVSPEGLEEFRELTGMDPWRDFQAVCVFTQADSDAKESWGMAIAGAFDPERAVASLEARGRVERSKHREIVLYSFAALGPRGSKGAAPHSLAFPDGSTALVGTAEAVRKMLDAGYGFSPSAAEGELKRSLDELTMGETVWLVGGGGSADGSRPAPAPEVIRSEIGSIQSFVLSAQVGSDIRVRAQGESRNEADAARLVDVVRGLAAMAALKAEAQTPAVEDLEVESEQNQWKLSFAIDGRTARKWFIEKKKDSEPKGRPGKSR